MTMSPFLVTRQRVGPASKTLARDKCGFFLGDIRFVAVATIARDVKESHLGAVVSNNGARTRRPISTVTFRFDMLFFPVDPSSILLPVPFPAGFKIRVLDGVLSG